MPGGNDQYPGLLELMPVDFPDKQIIDFGCGRARHDRLPAQRRRACYAVDSAWHSLESTRYRLLAHGFQDRCTLVCVGEGEWRLPEVDHVHTAGVIHHIEDPVGALNKLAFCLRKGAEIRMMVYDADSEFVKSCGGVEQFEYIADGEAPIAKAWTEAEVKQIAGAAGLKATLRGRYLVPGETVGPGLSACYSLKLDGRDRDVELVRRAG